MLVFIYFIHFLALLFSIYVYNNSANVEMDSNKFASINTHIHAQANRDREREREKE